MNDNGVKSINTFHKMLSRDEAGSNEQEGVIFHLSCDCAHAKLGFRHRVSYTHVQM